MFDANEFLNSTIAATDRKLVPAGLFPFSVEDVKAASGTSKEGKPWARLDLVLSLDSDEVRNATGRPVNKLTYGIMLDLDETTGQVVLTKGGRLDKIRKALGDTSESFSPMALKGRYGKAQIEHEMYKDAPIERVTAVLPA